jgi:hypothetical protein
MSLEAFLRMLHSDLAVRLVHAGMPPEATLDDARALHRRMKQVGRKRCSFLDDPRGTENR